MIGLYLYTCLYIYIYMCVYLYIDMYIDIYIYIYIVYTLCFFVLLSPYVFISSVSLSPPTLWWFSFIHQTYEAVLPLALPCQQAVGAPTHANTPPGVHLGPPLNVPFPSASRWPVFNWVRVFVWDWRKHVCLLSQCSGMTLLELIL